VANWINGIIHDARMNTSDLQKNAYYIL